MATGKARVISADGKDVTGTSPFSSERRSKPMKIKSTAERQAEARKRAGGGKDYSDIDKDTAVTRKKQAEAVKQCFESGKREREQQIREFIKEYGVTGLTDIQTGQTGSFEMRERIKKASRDNINRQKAKKSGSGGSSNKSPDVSPMAKKGVDTTNDVSPMAQKGSRSTRSQPVLGSKDIQPFDLQRNPNEYNQRTTYRGTQLYTPEVQQQQYEVQRQQQRQEAATAMNLGQSDRKSNLPTGPGPALVNARSKDQDWEKTAQTYESGVADTLTPLTNSQNPLARFTGGAIEVAAYAPTAIPRLGKGLATNPTATIRETVLGQAEMVQKDPARGAGQLLGMLAGPKIIKGISKTPAKVPYRLTRTGTEPGILLKTEMPVGRAAEAPRGPTQYTIPTLESAPRGIEAAGRSSLRGRVSEPVVKEPGVFTGKETSSGMVETFVRTSPEQLQQLQRKGITFQDQGFGKPIKTDYGSFRVVEPFGKSKRPGAGPIQQRVTGPRAPLGFELPFRFERKQRLTPAELEIQGGKTTQGNIIETTAGKPRPQIPKKTKGPYDPVTPEEMAYAKILTTALRDEPMYYQAASSVSSRIGRELGVQDISGIGLKISDGPIFGGEVGSLGATGYLKNTPIRDIHIAGTKYQPPGEVIYTLGHELGHATQKGGVTGPTMVKEAVAGKFGTKFAKKFEDIYGIEVYKDSGFAGQPISARIRDPYKLGISMEAAPVDFARTSGRFKKPSGKPQQFKEVQSLDRDFYIEDYKPVKTRDPMFSDLMKEPVLGKSKAKTAVKTKESASPFKDDLQALVDASQAQFKGKGKAAPDKQVFARPNINQKPKGMTGSVPFANFGMKPGSQFNPGRTPGFNFKPPSFKDPFTNTNIGTSNSPIYSPSTAPQPGPTPTPPPTPQMGSPGLTGLFTEPKPPRYFPEGKKKQQKRKSKVDDIDEFKNIWENPVAFGFDLLR